MDDWSLIGDPATVMVFTDSAKATSGFDLGFEKAMASDLDGLRWRPLFKSQSWTLWVHDSIDAIWALSVDEFAPIYYARRSGRFDRILHSEGSQQALEQWSSSQSIQVWSHCFFQPKVQTSWILGWIHCINFSCRFTHQASIIYQEFGCLSWF